MSTVCTAASYDSIPDFGVLYDAVPAYGARQDVAFYVAEAVRHGGPVLELGCGTGRVLIPTAKAGVTVTGLDGSEQMLARCREKLANESDAVRSRVELLPGDARDFTLSTTFPLIVAPFRVFQQLVTIDDQIRCLGAVARHLSSGGRFIFDVFNPAFATMVTDRSVEREDTPELTLPDGRTLRRAARILRVRWIDQVSEAELIYYLAPQAGVPATRYVQAFEMRWYVRTELEHLLARAGLRVESIHGDFHRTPLTDASPEMVVTAVRE